QTTTRSSGDSHDNSRRVIMMIAAGSGTEHVSGRGDGFIDELSLFASDHRAARWRGTFAEFLRDILPAGPARYSRSSHQYLYDMLCWYREARRTDGEPSNIPREHFTSDLYGIDDSVDRVAEYFKAASAGSDV